MRVDIPAIDWHYDPRFFAGRPVSELIEKQTTYQNGIADKQDEVINQRKYQNRYDGKGRLISSEQTDGGEENFRVTWY